MSRGRLPLASRFALVAGLALAGEAAAQRAAGGSPPIPDIDDFVFDGSVAEWRARPVDRVLPASVETPQALTWIGQVPEGLVVAAEIRGAVTTAGAPVLEIALAGPEPPTLPPVGWGHQFGIEVLADSTGCEGLEYGSSEPSDCRAWYREQLAFRAALPPLFERLWRLPLRGGDDMREVRATPAFEALDEASKRRLAPLAPVGSPAARTRPIAGTEGGVGYEIFIPWSAFPPVRAPALDAIRIQLGWTADPRGSFAEVVPRALARSLHHLITPCDYGLAGLLVPGADDRAPRRASDDAVAYMRPEPSGDLRSLILLDHPVAGYQYDPDPEARSPSAFLIRYEVLDVGRDERLCAPILALAKGGKRLSPADWTMTGEGSGWSSPVDLRYLEVRRLEDGDLLALQRPRVSYSYYGAGQCGACPRVSVDLHHISVGTGAVTPLLRVTDVAEVDARDIEIEVAEDWSRVTVFRGLTDWSTDPPRVRWTATHYCPEATRDQDAPFVECGVDQGVPEPPVRLRARYGGSP